MGNNGKILERIKECRADCNYGKGKHTKAAKRKNRYNHLIGVPAILISLLISTSFFLTLKSEFPEYAKWLGAFVALISAAFSGVQTYFAFPKVVEGHRRSACKFRNLGKKCSNTIAAYEDGVINDEQLYKSLNEITEEYSEITTDAETFPTNDDEYLKTKEEINSGNEQYTQKELETRS